MTATLIDGISSRTLKTDRLNANILERDGDDPNAEAVVFIHGNVSSSLFWQPTMLRLPANYRAIAIDLRGFGDSETLAVDATRGLADYSDDVASVLRALGIESAHFVGWSMGGGVVQQLMLDHNELVRTVTLQAPVSPYGFGPTALDGSLLTPDAAGSGAGGVNPDFKARLHSGDRTADEQTSPRSVFRSAYVAPGYQGDHEDLWVESMLTTKVADGNYPGNSTPSENWPGFAPGDRGVLNTMAPTYFNTTGIVDLAVKPPVLWIHGTQDAIVSDTSYFDLNYLGQLGAIPGWPGEEVAPAQPMKQQTRNVLMEYEAAGGSVTEIELENCGHSPQLEYPEKFDAALHAHLLGRTAV
ncbi:MULTISPECIES: alpha/beta hydrolase [unclassified Cryobacterium]|uniref:alpha/beta hydrolase n=1 Tax=unclassified Cryobacterium TaxID=2649013 RepID=UPI001445ED91|nr:MULTISPECIES: alpha/beta hydrolase [unclassified Cryobacterium]